MSTKLSFKEARARLGETPADRRGDSTSPTIRITLRAGAIEHPIDIVRLLQRGGLSLKKAHNILNRLAAGEVVATEVQTNEQEHLIAELAKLGVSAHVIQVPAVDARLVREKIGLSQAEFAARFAFELDTIQNWEQGRNSPDSPTQILLKIISDYPGVVDLVLATSSDPTNTFTRRYDMTYYALGGFTASGATVGTVKNSTSFVTDASSLFSAYLGSATQNKILASGASTQNRCEFCFTMTTAVNKVANSWLVQQNFAPAPCDEEEVA